VRQQVVQEAVAYILVGLGGVSKQVRYPSAEALRNSQMHVVVLAAEVELEAMEQG
jgi:hypothetical protein